jgi:hypothetical protein
LYCGVGVALLLEKAARGGDDAAAFFAFVAFAAPFAVLRGVNAFAQAGRDFCATTYLFDVFGSRMMVEQSIDFAESVMKMIAFGFGGGSYRAPGAVPERTAR